jgi:hypothetical protein
MGSQAVEISEEIYRACRFQSTDGPLAQADSGWYVLVACIDRVRPSLLGMAMNDWGPTWIVDQTA